MKTFVFAFALAAIASASPFPQGSTITSLPTVSIPSVPSLPSITSVPATTTANGTKPTRTRTKGHNPHKEPTPSFRLPCLCSKPIVPIDLLTPNERCEFEYAFAMGCYFRAQGGCPSPVMNCPHASPTS